MNMQIRTWLRLGGLCLSIFAVVVICAGLFRTGIFSGVVGAQARNGAEVQSRRELAQAPAQQMEDGRRDRPGRR